MMKIRLPNINAPTEKGQLLQIRSFLHQLVEELNWAMDVLASGDALPGETDAVTDETVSKVRGLVIKHNDKTYVTQKEFKQYQMDMSSSGGSLQVLAEGTDANGFVSFGDYAVDSDTLAASLVNFPCIMKGIFRVWSGDGSGKTTGDDVSILQEFSCYDNSVVYRRAMIWRNVGWEYGPWKEIVSETQIDTEIM